MPIRRAAIALLWAAAAAADLAVELLPNVTTYDIKGSPTACGGGALQSCQDTGVGNMASPEYPMGSAADTLLAMRFQNFTSGGAAASTDRNVGSVLADYAFSTTMTTSRIDELKHLKGTANLDLFLCSDDVCSIIVDIAHVNDGTGSDPVLAMGYLRFARSLISLPIQHITKATPHIVSTNASTTESSSSVQAAEQAKVAWEVDNLEWVAANPVMMPFGSLVRFLSLSVADGGELASNLGSLRIGSYQLAADTADPKAAAAGDCVYIITFSDANGWMDAQGWNTSHDCDPDPATARVYVFDSYFPQANLVWPSVNGSFTLADTIGAGNWREVLDPAVVAAYGRTLSCDSTMFTSDQTVAPAEHSCYTANANYTQTLPGESIDGISRPPSVLVVGNAAITAWDITADALEPDDSAGATPTTYAFPGKPDYANDGNGRNPVRGFKPVGSGIYTTGALGTLLQHAVLSSRAWAESNPVQQLPWCQQQARGDGTARGVIEIDDEHVSIYDCDRLYTTAGDRLNWGSVGPGPRPALTGQQLLQLEVQGGGIGGLLRPSWTSLEEPYMGEGNQEIEGRGFAGAERTFVSSLRVAVDAAAGAAAAVLDEYAGDSLSNMDATLTALGAVLALSQTVVALLATYVGRREIVVFFVKRRVPLLAARILTVLIFAFGIITPAALVATSEYYARQGNPGGGETTVRWVRAQAHGYGPYQVVGAVAMSFSTVYDSTAYIITWVNLALATAGWLWCTVYIVSRRKLSGDALVAEARGGRKFTAPASRSPTEPASDNGSGATTPRSTTRLSGAPAPWDTVPPGVGADAYRHHAAETFMV